jgi:adenosine deaminase
MRNFAAEAKASLNVEDVAFLKSLPKADLHAHLNGCIPLSCLQTLAAKRSEQISQSSKASREANNDSDSDKVNDAISNGLKVLEQGVMLEEIHQFFDLFPAIYALTSTPETLAIATRAVLEQFLEPGWTGPDDPPQCTYLELRTTPRQNESMTRLQYLEAVLGEIERYSKDKCALIASVDRRMDSKTMLECVEAAATLKAQGRRIVGIDLCGTPTVGNGPRYPWTVD